LETIITTINTSPLSHSKVWKGFDMSLFSKILDKLGLRKDKDDDQPAATKPTSAPVAAPPKPTTPSSTAKPTPRPATTSSTPRPSPSRPSGGPSAVQQPPAAAPAAPAPKAISEVDVVKQLEQKAKGTGLNWKQSIVDLLTLLDIDHSREARIELAKELGAPEEVMGDSARMNTWLHKTVLKKIAENGGNIPQNLLD
jgi:hypothetical protein